jgi:serine/threonine protein kinase
MPSPSTSQALLELIRKSGLVDDNRLDAFLKTHPLPAEPKPAADLFVRAGLLTRFHARLLLVGKHRGFFLGPYKVLEPLARGGMSAVYRGEHTTLRRPVAIKVLPTALAEDRAILERFYREARAVAALDHPNIIRAHDVTQSGGLHYFVMEYVEGINLEDYITKKGPLPHRRAVGLALQAAAALEHVHERGLVHRDIKPANLLLDKQGVIKVLDMGLARFFLDPSDDLTRKLSDTSVLGTADYIAPEQALNSHAADIRADLYGLGGTLYALIHGRPPFGGKTISQKLMAHQVTPLKPLHEVVPGVPEGLSDVVSRMMAKKPEERYQSPAEVIEALRPWGSRGRRQGIWHWRRWRVVAAAAVALVSVSIGVWLRNAGSRATAQKLPEDGEKPAAASQP